MWKALCACSSQKCQKFLQAHWIWLHEIWTDLRRTTCSVERPLICYSFFNCAWCRVCYCGEKYEGTWSSSNSLDKLAIVINDYNSGISSVDLFDQRIAAYRLLWKTNKYWTSFGIAFLYGAVVNSFIFPTFYKADHPDVIMWAKTYDAHEFCRQLICPLANMADDAQIPHNRQVRKPKLIPSWLAPGAQHFTGNFEELLKKTLGDTLFFPLDLYAFT